MSAVAIENGAIEGATSGPDPDRGRLFDVPRVSVLTDEADPTVLKLAFSGSIELDRSNAEQVAFYNALIHGETTEVAVAVFIAGAKKTHRRDAEGEVDAIVETKSVVVGEVFPVEP
jgi:hypothetical protein